MRRRWASIAGVLPAIVVVSVMVTQAQRDRERRAAELRNALALIPAIDRSLFPGL